MVARVPTHEPVTAQEFARFLALAVPISCRPRIAPSGGS